MSRPTATGTGLVIHGGAAAVPPPNQVVLRDYDLSLMALYGERYAGADPVAPVAFRQPHQPVRMSDVVPDSRFGRDAFTGDFAGPHGVRRGISVFSPLADGRILTYCVYREPGRRDFRRAEVDAVGHLTPTLNQAAQQVLRLEELAGAAPPWPSSAAALVYRVEGRTAQVLRTSGGAQGVCEALQRLDPDPLAQEARDLLASLRPRTERRLRLPDGRWLEARLAPLGPREVLARVAVLAPGTSAYVRAEAERRGLTPREQQVAGLALDGLSNKEIAARLGRSPHTIKLQLSSACRRIGVEGRAELAATLAGVPLAP